MRKNILLLCTFMLAAAISLVGCANDPGESSALNNTKIEDTADTDVASSKEKETSKEVMSEESISEEDSTEDTAQESLTEEISSENESESEEASDDTDTEDVTETESETPEVTTHEPATDEEPTEPSTEVAVTATEITASVGGTHYIGDVLSAADFVITVTMSDGSVLTNPAGWQADGLNLTGASTNITVSYGDLSTVVTVNASERPAETQPVETQPQPAETQPVETQPQVATYDGLELVKNACSYVGRLPYVLGGHSLSTGADCSNFTSLIYEQYGASLYYSAIDQFNQGTKISPEEARPGDLVVTDGTKGFATHAGIYIGVDQYGSRIYVSELPGAEPGSGNCYITHVTDAFEYRRIGNNTCTLSPEQAGLETKIHLENIGNFYECAPCFGEKDEDGRCYFHFINIFRGEENVYFDDPARAACIEWCKSTYLERGYEKFW